MRRIALSPRWIGWGVVALAAAVTCILLGRWQLGRAEDSGNLQNWGYAIQWPLFAVFFALLWWRMMRLDGRAAKPAPAADSVTEPDPVPVEQHVPAPRHAEIVKAEQDDPELAAYNRFLAELAARDSRD